MQGSDDEFDDWDLDDEEEDEGEQTSPPHQASTATLHITTGWFSNLTPLTISDFNSSVGPTLPLPETASEA